LVSQKSFLVSQKSFLAGQISILATTKSISSRDLWLFILNNQVDEDVAPAEAPAGFNILLLKRSNLSVSPHRVSSLWAIPGQNAK
jgi:hypothetical protein